MRILVATDVCAPSVGGVQTFLAGLVGELAREHTVSLIAGPGDVTPHPDVDLIATLPLSSPADRREQAAMELALVEAAIVTAADVVVLATAGLALYAAAMQRQCPVVVVVHGKDLTQPWQRVPCIDDAGAAAQVIARALDVCAVRIFVSQATRNQARALGVVGDGVVVAPGFALGALSPVDAATRAQLRAGLGVDDDRFVIATVARLVPRKGHLVVIDAIAAGDERVAGSVYFVVGAGDAAAAIEAHARARGVDVRMLGALSFERVREVYRAADVHVLVPTEIRNNDGSVDVEGYGLSILEAAACGTPSIGSRSGGVPETLADGVSGVLVAAGDSTALGAAFARLAHDPLLRARLAAGARRRALGHGGHVATADAVVAVLEAAIERAR